jgi:hypothetical protein
LLARAARTRTHRRIAERTAEAAVEVRDVGEAGLHGNLADLESCAVGIAQDGGSAIEPALQKMLRETSSGRLQQPMQIARRHAELCRHARRVEIGLARAR